MWLNSKKVSLPTFEEFYNQAHYFGKSKGMHTVEESSIIVIWNSFKETLLEHKCLLSFRGDEIKKQKFVNTFYDGCINIRKNKNKSNTIPENYYLKAKNENNSNSQSNFPTQQNYSQYQQYLNHSLIHSLNHTFNHSLNNTINTLNHSLNHSLNNTIHFSMKKVPNKIILHQKTNLRHFIHLTIFLTGLLLPKQATCFLLHKKEKNNQKNN